MVNSILLLILRWFSPEAPDLRPMVACEAAYTLQTMETPAVVDKKCCGLCRNGTITHGDGHKTPCPCPGTCECKTKGALHHPPAQLHDCPGGKCNLKQTK